MKDKGVLAAQGGLSSVWGRVSGKSVDPTILQEWEVKKKHTFRESDRSVRRKRLVELEAPLENFQFYRDRELGCEWWGGGGEMAPEGIYIWEVFME